MKNVTMVHPWKWCGRALVSTTILGAAACSSDSSESAADGQRSTEGTSGTHVIRIDVGSPGHWQRIEIPPVTPRIVTAPEEEEADSEPAQDGPAIEPASAEVVGERRSALSVGTSTNAWLLLMGAAAECGMIGGEVPAGERIHPAVASMIPEDPNNTRGWYLFPRAPGTCDEALAFSEVLLCSADMLAHLGEAIEPIEWPRAGRLASSSLATTLPSGTWRILPQLPKDRFIARDLALDALSQIAVLDARPPSLAERSGEFRSCGDLYS